mgnify:CR=1 FL=1
MLATVHEYKHVYIVLKQDSQYQVSLYTVLSQKTTTSQLLEPHLSSCFTVICHLACHYYTVLILIFATFILSPAF